MALSAAIVFEVRTGGADTNGGGFKTGATGTDWTLQDAAQYSVTDGVAAGTTTITSVTANFGTDVVGNLIYIQGGTGSITAGWYEITARASSVSITVDRSTGLTAGTGVTLKIGGALATPGLAASLMTVAGQYCYVKSGTYTISTTSAGAAGPVSISSTAEVTMEGYGSARGDLGTRPELNAGVQTTVNLFTGGGSTGGGLLLNMKANGNSKTAVSGFKFTGTTVTMNCVFCEAVSCDQASAAGFIGLNDSSIKCVGCKAESCTTGFSQARCDLCEAEACGTGFVAGVYQSLNRCLAYDCTSVGFSLSGPSNGSMLCSYCTAKGCTSHGFTVTTGTGNLLIGCVATDNGGAGFNLGTSITYMVKCASRNNTSGATAGTAVANWGAIALSGDPWVDASTDDYRPDATANEGALLRGTAIAFPNQTINTDLGAVQHADPAGGSGGMPTPALIFGQRGVLIA